MAEGDRTENIRRVIARRDAVALRRMAGKSRTQEGRMWLALLARMLEVDSGRPQRGRQQFRVSAPAISANRRVALGRTS